MVKTRNKRNQWIYNEIHAISRIKGRADTLRELAWIDYPVDLLESVPVNIIAAVPAFRLHRRRRRRNRELAALQTTTTASDRLRDIRYKLNCEVFEPPEWGVTTDKPVTMHSVLKQVRSRIRWREPSKYERAKAREVVQTYADRRDWVPMSPTIRLDGRACALVGPLRRGIAALGSDTVVAPMDKPDKVHNKHETEYRHGRYVTGRSADTYYKYTAAVRQTGPQQYQYRVFDDEPVTVNTSYPIKVEGGYIRYDVQIAGEVVDHHTHPMNILTRTELRQICVDKLRKRRKADKIHSEQLGNTPRCTKVTRATSYAVGNCAAGTEAWLTSRGIHTGRKFIRVYELVGGIGDNVHAGRVLSLIISKHKDDECPALKRIEASLERS